MGELAGVALCLREKELLAGSGQLLPLSSTAVSWQSRGDEVRGGYMYQVLVSEETEVLSGRAAPQTGAWTP